MYTPIYSVISKILKNNNDPYLYLKFCHLFKLENRRNKSTLSFEKRSSIEYSEFIDQVHQCLTFLNMLISKKDIALTYVCLLGEETSHIVVKKQDYLFSNFEMLNDEGIINPYEKYEPGSALAKYQDSEPHESRKILHVTDNIIQWFYLFTLEESQLIKILSGSPLGKVILDIQGQLKEKQIHEANLKNLQQKEFQKIFFTKEHLSTHEEAIIWKIFCQSAIRR